jgi:hypothetical protein
LPEGTPSSHVITAEVPPETDSDTDDIFNVTNQEPADSVVVSQPSPSERTEQQDIDIEEEATLQPEAAHVDSVDVSVQDTAAPHDLHGSKRDNSASEVQLVHNQSHEGHQVDPEEQLPMQTQHSGGNQHHNEDQDSTSRQHSVEDQRSSETEHTVEDNHPTEEPHLAEAIQTVAPVSHLDVGHKAPASNEGQNMQHSPIPAETNAPALMDAQHLLRGVTNRSGEPRVAKNKRKPAQPGSIPRNPNPTSYTASQLYQLAEYTKEQERLQEKQNWARDLVANQEQLKRANQHRSKLQAECVQLKVSLEKYSKLTEHLKTIVKFENGLGRDLKELQSSNNKCNSEIRKIKFQLEAEERAKLNAVVDSVPGQIAKIAELRVNSLRVNRELESSITTLQKEKSDLENRLLKASEALAQEKARQAAFDERLETFGTARNSAEETLNGCISNINDRLSEFKTFIEQGTLSSETSRGLLELMKKEGAILFNQVRSAGTNLETMKTSVAALSSG